MGLGCCGEDYVELEYNEILNKKKEQFSHCVCSFFNWSIENNVWVAFCQRMICLNQCSHLFLHMGIMRTSKMFTDKKWSMSVWPHLLLCEVACVGDILNKSKSNYRSSHMQNSCIQGPWIQLFQPPLNSDRICRDFMLRQCLPLSLFGLCTAVVKVTAFHYHL